MDTFQKLWIMEKAMKNNSFSVDTKNIAGDLYNFILKESYENVCEMYGICNKCGEKLSQGALDGKSVLVCNNPECGYNTTKSNRIRR